MCAHEKISKQNNNKNRTFTADMHELVCVLTTSLQRTPPARGSLFQTVEVPHVCQSVLDL